MTTEKPSRNEDEYFARQDAELMKEQRARLAREQDEAERRRHFMKCPRDGYDLEAADLHGVQIDHCTHCGGIWLDRGELAAIEAHHDRPGLLARFFGDVLTGIRTTHMPPDPEDHLRHHPQRQPGNPKA